MDGIQVESAWDEALQLNPETRLVSAVILYKSRVGFNGQISLWWSIFKNPFAINPLKEKVVETIEKALNTPPRKTIF